MNTITDYLNNLSDDEKALHQKLIAECLLREKQINERKDATKQNIMRLDAILMRHTEDLLRINHAMRDLSTICREIRDREALRLLELIPEDTFHCA